MFLNHNNEIFVGSACGGYDFYAKKQGEDKFIWLGANKESDIDVYSDHPINGNGIRVELKNLNKFKESWTGRYNFWLGYECPYKTNGKLHIPNDKTYLCWGIGKKLKLNLKEMIKIKGSFFDIYNPEKQYLFTINFVPISPILFYKEQIKIEKLKLK